MFKNFNPCCNEGINYSSDVSFVLKQILQKINGNIFCVIRFLYLLLPRQILERND